MSAVAQVDFLVEQQVSVTLNLVDGEHPWLGLDSFSEETRQFFHGREEEVAELARRVQRKTLSILFGQSGLGKTSILRAGIVPRLRREGYCPVYVRIDYARESPAPSQQIKQAIFRATEGAGKWTRPGSAVPGESLWEFLHHRDDVLLDASGRALTPLLIFDQFEEIFTLGQDDAFGRERAAEFIEDLADLVENRPPKALEMMLEDEETTVERFDFNRADYRILIALREDYLAHLEGLKPQMPSITQNRMRLARMTGAQALAAVVKPGGRLVTEEVAESIVRFVAGGSELRNAEVEPSLLSLVCRELNNTRIAQGRGEISPDLLAGSRDTILHEFYERALADQPAGVRRFIEDEMLTESGFRESLAEERVLRAFAAAGAPPGALPALVNRRLLRIEERLDLRRVELTHDVLSEVVQESRELRHEREAKEEAERELAAQREREAATHKALVRARQVAAGCAVLAIGAIAGAVFGYVNMKRAQEAEAKAQSTRLMAESARGEAEKLLVYLLDDFQLELAPVGRLDVVANLSKRAIDYYAALPAELRTGDTQRNRALAQVRYGYALRNLGKTDEAGKVLGDAVSVLRGLHRGGETSEATAIGLGLGLSGIARVMDSVGRVAEGAAHAVEAEAVLRPLVGTELQSIPLRRTYALVTNYLGFTQLRSAREEDAVRSFEAARESLRRIDGLTEDLAAMAAYAEAIGWQMEALDGLERDAEAMKLGEEGVAVAGRVLERRPGDMMALRSRALVSANLADLAFEALRHRQALEYGRASVRDWQALVERDPGNYIGWNNLAASRIRIAFALQELGRGEEALAAWRSALDVERNVKEVPPSLAFNLIGTAGLSSLMNIELGRPLRGGTPDHHRFAKMAVAAIPQDSPRRAMTLEIASRFDGGLAYESGRTAEARQMLEASIRRLDAVKPAGTGETRFWLMGQTVSHKFLGLAAYAEGDYPAAEKALRTALDYRERVKTRVRSERTLDVEHTRVMLGLTLARQKRSAEALALLAPAVKLNRERYRAGSDGTEQRLLLAKALLGTAIATPAEKAALLDEADRVLKSMPGDASRFASVNRARGWVAQERTRS